MLRTLHIHSDTPTRVFRTHKMLPAHVYIRNHAHYNTRDINMSLSGSTRARIRRSARESERESEEPREMNGCSSGVDKAGVSRNNYHGSRPRIYIYTAEATSRRGSSTRCLTFSRAILSPPLLLPLYFAFLSPLPSPLVRQVQFNAHRRTLARVLSSPCSFRFIVALFFLGRPTPWLYLCRHAYAAYKCHSNSRFP